MEFVIHEAPFSPAGSICEDGPLPQTEMDLVREQADYARLNKDADLILMLGSTLHSIGVSNLAGDRRRPLPRI